MIILTKLPRIHSTYFIENSESLALGCLAAFLRKHGRDVLIFDASLEGLQLNDAKKKLLELTIKHKPILIGFTIADMTFIESTIESINFLRENGINTHMTLGGHSPTFDYKNILEMCKGLDSVIRFEGELPLLSLVNRLKDNQNWHDIKNIAYRTLDGEIIANEPEPLIGNLDELPFSSRDYLPYVFEHINDIGIVTIYASRGCYNNCGFCSIRKFYGPPKGPLWRTRSVDNIVSEIKQLKEKWPSIREIVFVDDLFLGSPSEKIKRIKYFKDSLLNNDLKLILSISERVDNINDEIGAIWNEMGVRQVLIGLESGIPEILKKMNKGITLEEQQKALSIFEKYEIDPTPSFINFTPWSTIENIIENTKYFLSLHINLLQGLLNRFQIYHGTPLSIELENAGITYGSFPNISYRTPDERVDRLYNIVNKSFGPYLFIAYNLKLLEREIRFALFDARNNPLSNNLNDCLSSRKLYKYLLDKIMEEASAIFIKAAEDLKDGFFDDPKSIEIISELVYSKANQWARMIESFRIMCPVLIKNDGGINEIVRKKAL